MNYSIASIAQDLLPKEGSKDIVVPIVWAGNQNIPPTQFPINLQQQSQSNQFRSCQAVFVDNSTVPYSITIYSLETQQSLCIPAFSQAMLPVFSGGNPSFLVTVNYFPSSYDNQSSLFIPCTTTLHFLNTPQRYYSMSLPNYGNAGGWNTFSLTWLAGNNDYLSVIGPGTAPAILPNGHLILSQFNSRMFSIIAGAAVQPQPASFFGFSLFEIQGSGAAWLASTSNPTIINQIASMNFFLGSTNAPGGKIDDWNISFTPPYLAQQSGSSIYIQPNNVTVPAAGCQFIVTGNASYGIVAIS